MPRNRGVGNGVTLEQYRQARWRAEPNFRAWPLGLTSALLPGLQCNQLLMPQRVVAAFCAFVQAIPRQHRFGILRRQADIPDARRVDGDPEALQLLCRIGGGRGKWLLELRNSRSAGNSGSAVLASVPWD